MSLRDDLDLEMIFSLSAALALRHKMTVWWEKAVGDAVNVCIRGSMSCNVERNCWSLIQNFSSLDVEIFEAM